MIYLIGGAPRVGKTTLVNYLVQRYPMHAVSTDALRYMLRRTVPEQVLNPDIFIHFRTDIMQLWDKDHQATLDEQNRQSKALWPYMREFIHSYDEDGIDLIIEGVAVLPEFAVSLDVDNRSIFLGNTGTSHQAIIAEQAKGNAHDWMHALPEDTVARAAEFFTLLSKHFKTEAAVRNLSYYEVSDADFDQSMQTAAAQLLP